MSLFSLWPAEVSAFTLASGRPVLPRCGRCVDNSSCLALPDTLSESMLDVKKLVVRTHKNKSRLRRVAAQ